MINILACTIPTFGVIMNISIEGKELNIVHEGILTSLMLRMMHLFLIGSAVPDILWYYGFQWATCIMNQCRDWSIGDLSMVKWCDGKGGCGWLAG